MDHQYSVYARGPAPRFHAVSGPEISPEMAKESIKESGADKGLQGIGFSLVVDVSGEKF